MPMPFHRWMLLLMTTGWHARARLHPLLLACAFLAFAGTQMYAADGVTPARAATPEAAVRLFYPWYLGEMMKGRVPLTEEGMHDYVAADTLRDIMFVMNRPVGGKRGLQEDYFLHAKDYFDDWADHIAVSEVAIDGDTASALVALGDPWQGTQELALTLVREDGGWKISRVNEAAASK